MIKIYHNPRCGKSREGLKIVEESKKDFEIIKYLENLPTKEELGSIINLLGINSEDLLRKNEAIWKENYRGKSLSNDEILDAMLAHPKLIERPIVVNGSKAIIGRPPEKIKSIL
ncbi:arsenate reductase (glutaredoxin) [Maribacter algarum]|uniref:Arsenate reductase (Glutaredoxin) n=1 Tax=Maribacter algarum (ex Zhang et al. 2020) TaxID=2578118 RepID=A0A5S3QHJ5_9FLAO|nr:arsenate reductase (glutaredoxin) [Maribacter algarum]TMM57005.1 arsenate reductase (glutaredoxin) [Maribacter algarum]